MKHIFILLIIIGLKTNAQDFTTIQKKIENYPKIYKVDHLTTQINKDFTTDEQKVKAAFYWLASNIRYDLQEFHNPKQRNYTFTYSSQSEKTEKLQAITDKVVETTFRTKKGVCEQYAQSFKKICDLLQIEAEVITGYTRNSVKDIGQIPRNSNHAWNAVKLDNKWLILDATWAAGSVQNRKWVRNFNSYFYNIPKQKIFKTHYPEDSLWVLRFGRMSLDKFYNQPIYSMAFLKANTKLVLPKSGILQLNTNKKIQLTFKNLSPNTKVFYTLSGNRLAQTPTLIKNETFTTLIIQNAKTKSELTLFFNKKSALEFKIL